MSRADMDSVLDKGLRAAIHKLDEDAKPFQPFAVVKTREGVIQFIQTESRASADEIITELTEQVRRSAAAENYQSVAIVSDVRLRDRLTVEVIDAVRVAMEDSEAAPVNCYLPYSRKNNAIVIGEVVAEAGNSRIFVP